jgi:hypothetical protein
MAIQMEIAEDLAPVNRFAVTIYLADPTRQEERTVEILRRSQYERCRPVHAVAVFDGGQLVAVTGFSVEGYDQALALARWHARQLGRS